MKKKKKFQRANKLKLNLESLTSSSRDYSGSGPLSGFINPSRVLGDRKVPAHLIVKPQKKKTIQLKKEIEKKK